jgi:hypothetical protein
VTTSNISVSLLASSQQNILKSSMQMISIENHPRISLTVGYERFEAL